MKYILFFLLLVGLNATAQTEKPLTKVVIKYFKGYDPFNQFGVYSRGEIIEISAVHDSLFKINHYFKITDTQVDSSITKKDTVEIRSGSNRLIPKKIIDNLYVQLNTTKDNFNISFIKPLLKRPTKKRILAEATKLDKHYKFEDEYTHEAKKRITKIRNFAKLDSFVNLNKPNPNEYMVIIDAWDRVDIYLIGKTDTVRYSGEFHQLLGQPFFKRVESKGIVNLQINTTIRGILPQSSILRKRLDINSLTDEYIDWYIEKVL